MEKTIRTINDLKEAHSQRPGDLRKLALAVAQDKSALSAVMKAYEQKIITPVLLGDEAKIRHIASELNLNIAGIEIIHEPDDIKCIALSVKLAHDGQVQILMKGGVKTPDLMRGVLNKDFGLRSGQLLSHFALFQVPNYHKLIAITDVALSIAPTLHEKVSIVENSVAYFHKMGVSCPKVAVLGAIEMVNEKMTATLDAALLSKMNQRDQITGCLIDGPLAFDNAISKESALTKKIKSSVAGDCDLLLVPDIEVGNVLYKTLVFFANAEVASIVLGATVPIVLTSRSDSEATKLNSILLATFG